MDDFIESFSDDSQDELKNILQSLELNNIANRVNAHGAFPALKAILKDGDLNEFLDRNGKSGPVLRDIQALQFEGLIIMEYGNTNTAEMTKLGLSVYDVMKKNSENLSEDELAENDTNESETDDAQVSLRESNEVDAQSCSEIMPFPLTSIPTLEVDSYETVSILDPRSSNKNEVNLGEEISITAGRSQFMVVKYQPAGDAASSNEKRTLLLNMDLIDDTSSSGDSEEPSVPSDTLLSIYRVSGDDRSCTPITSNDDGGEGLNAQLSGITLTESEKYLLHLNTVRGENADAILRVSEYQRIPVLR